MSVHRAAEQFDHVASVRQTSRGDPGDDVAAWYLVDYSKAYDFVRHPMMVALFRFTSIPAPWIY